MATVPYIGSKISLVSKADLRYEGTLFTIDPANSTVSLSNVVCFGTEDRLPDVTQGTDTVYPFLIFKGSDIKTLYVIEDIDVSAQAQSAPPNDPAIIGTTAPAQSPNAAVIAAAKAKSDAERSEKRLAQQMAQTSISGKQPEHPVGFPPRPAMPPAGQYGGAYGYQPQGMWYAPAAAGGGVPYGSLRNPSYPGLQHLPPMPYPPHPYGANSNIPQPPDPRMAYAAGNVPQPDPRQPQMMTQLPPQQPSSQAAARFRHQPSLTEPEPAPQQPGPKPVASAARHSTLSSPRDSYTGRGTTTDYPGPRRFRYNANSKDSAPPVNAEQAVPAIEFDFQSSNARFDKESFIRNLSSPRDQEPNEAQPIDSAQNAAQSALKKYDKASSFFDDISLDRDERGRKENRRGQNEETFGTIAAGFTSSNYRRNFNRNRRGRSNNSTRRNDNTDAATPHSPIRRADQQPSRPRGSPRSGDGKGKPRRGRRSSVNHENSSQETRTRNGQRSTGQTGQITGATSSHTV